MQQRMNWKRLAIELAAAATTAIAPLRLSWGQTCDCQPRPQLPADPGLPALITRLPADWPQQWDLAPTPPAAVSRTQGSQRPDSADQRETREDHYSYRDPFNGLYVSAPPRLDQFSDKAARGTADGARAGSAQADKASRGTTASGSGASTKTTDTAQDTAATRGEQTAIGGQATRRSVSGGGGAGTGGLGGASIGGGLSAFSSGNGGGPGIGGGGSAVPGPGRSSGSWSPGQSSGGGSGGMGGGGGGSRSVTGGSVQNQTSSTPPGGQPPTVPPVHPSAHPPVTPPTTPTPPPISPPVVPPVEPPTTPPTIPPVLPPVIPPGLPPEDPGDPGDPGPPHKPPVCVIDPPLEQLPDPEPPMPIDDRCDGPPVRPPGGPAGETPVVPEPGSLVLLGLGGAVSGIAWRRRRAAQR